MKTRRGGSKFRAPLQAFPLDISQDSVRGALEGFTPICCCIDRELGSSSRVAGLDPTGEITNNIVQRLAFSCTTINEDRHIVILLLPYPTSLRDRRPWQIAPHCCRSQLLTEAFVGFHVYLPECRHSYKLIWRFSVWAVRHTFIQK